jgi:hypothetical protein
MLAKYILAVLSAIFIVAAAWRLVREGGRVTPRSKTWFIIGVIFAIVSAWLWLR